jgi:hypothetical protein
LAGVDEQERKRGNQDEAKDPDQGHKQISGHLKADFSIVPAGEKNDIQGITHDKLY